MTYLKEPADRSDIKCIADRVRCMDLETVLQHLGARPDKYDSCKWHTQWGILSVNGSKFMNWNSRVGGGGAIDLVMHLNQVDFKTAIRWLDRFSVTPERQPSRQKSREKPKLQLPKEDPGKRRRIRNYLSKTRGLPETTIDPLMQSGKIYADVRGNAVFLLFGKDNNVVGAELRGTSHIPWKGMAPGSKKGLGFFAVNHPETKRIILCESAIDAISCFCMHPHVMSVSTAGVNPDPAWLPRLCDLGMDIFCGFDADQTGDEMAVKMLRLYPRIKRYRPELKDWNLLWIDTMKNQFMKILSTSQSLHIS